MAAGEERDEAKKWGQKNPAGGEIQQKLTKATEASCGVATGEIDKIMGAAREGERGILTAGGLAAKRRKRRRAAETQPKAKIRNPKSETNSNSGRKGNEENGGRGFIREFREFPRILRWGILTAEDADFRGWGTSNVELPTSNIEP
jgi:hypothetical protein